MLGAPIGVSRSVILISADASDAINRVIPLQAKRLIGAPYGVYSAVIVGKRSIVHSPWDPWIDESVPPSTVQYAVLPTGLVRVSCLVTGVPKFSGYG